MSTKRSQLEVAGFDPEAVERRENISAWSEVEQEEEVESRWRHVFRQMMADRLTQISFILVGLMAFMAVFARPLGPAVWPASITDLPLISTQQLQPLSLTPYDTGPRAGGSTGYEAPSLEHPMGTDRLGRDILSNVMAGARWSVSIGFVVTFLAGTFGVVYGAVAAYFGGKVDAVMMRIVDIIWAFPGLVLALVLIAVFGAGYWQLVAAFVLPGWLGYSRLIRGEILKIKQEEYVLAAKASGARDRSVLFRHIVPNAIPPVIVQATLSIGSVVIGVAALGFLGLGFDRGTAEWGTMLENERGTVITAGESTWDLWWVTVFPGAMIFIFVMALNIIGDSVNDALDAQAGDQTTNIGGG